MKSFGRTVTALAVVISVLGPGGQHSAFADDAVMSIDGSGVITPGQSITPTAQNVSLCGTGTVAAGDHADSYNFCFTGAGNGNLGGGNYCGALCGGLVGHVCFTFNGNVGTASSDDVDYDGRNGWIRVGVCVWQYTSINPMTSYNLHCVWTLGHA